MTISNGVGVREGGTILVGMTAEEGAIVKKTSGLEEEDVSDLVVFGGTDTV